VKKPGDSVPQFRGQPVDIVVDVRSRIEFWTGHLPGAVCVPVGHLPDGLARRAGVTPSSRILVYCSAGARSAAAAAQLRTAGYTNVIDGGAMADAREGFTP
jgi:rhodanese-related sulfurtransferase